MKIVEIDPREASEEQLRALHELWKVEAPELWPEDPVAPFEEDRAWLEVQPSYTFNRYWLASDESGGPLAFSSLRFQRKETNQHRAHLHLFARPDRRPSGFAPALLIPVAELARKEGRTSLNNWLLKDSVGTGFASHVGARQTTKDFENRLPVGELDRALIESWVERAPERAGEYSLRFWEGACPPELLESFAQAKFAMNDAPRGENEEDDVFKPEEIQEYEQRHVDAGFLIWTYAAIHDPTGQIGGYTQLFPGPWRPQLAWQEDTGVLPEHRNKGLGRWLKAQMLLRLLNEKPEAEWVVTWNATTNAAMLGINRALGFRAVREWGEWELALDDLEAWLEKRG